MKKQSKEIYLISFFLTFITMIAGFITLYFVKFSGYQFSSATSKYAKQLFQLDWHAYWPIILFLVGTLLIHIIYALIIAACSQLLIFRFYKNRPKLITSITWFASGIAIYLLNSFVYPHSTFAIQSLNAIPHIAYTLIAGAAFVVLFLVLCLACLYWAIHIYRRKTYRYLSLCFVIMIGVGYFLKAHHQLKNSEHKHYLGKQPNIILLVYCSARSDLLPITHFLKDYAKKSIWFKNAYTPLGRSEPAMYALLSGLYPIHSHFNFNLNWNDPRIKFKHLLPQILAKNGYQTVFISNGDLFIRMDKKVNYGFQLIDSKPHTIFAFILPDITDLPLTNLFLQLKWFKAFFPFSDNRIEDSVHYQPADFLARIQQVVEKKRVNKPLFLVIWDALPHYPYNVPGLNIEYPNKLLGNAVKYKMLYDMMDTYFAKYIKVFRKNGLLKNTILVVTSDHGESFGNIFPKDAPFHTYAHGSNAYGEGVFRVPLIIHYYHQPLSRFQPQVIKTHVSTLDIVPTLLKAINIIPVSQLDGSSLTSLIKNKRVNDDKRILYRQSGMTFALDKRFGEMTHTQQKASAFQSQAKFFQLGKDGSVFFKVSEVDLEKKRIEYAAQLGNILLVYTPKLKETPSSDGSPALLLINTKTLAMHYFLVKNYHDVSAVNKDKLVAIQEVKTNEKTFNLLYQGLIAYIRKAVG